ncbi:MAG: hypothetical protein NT147_04495 [Candidatus Aminicenantes bacterium]|nr:hypothetical protein [Candidatus Aminicenantes bacterium]
MEQEIRLESWKEISSYLKRSVKTCQRWEMELDLPIHRLDGTPSARVFAYPSELDGWIAEKLSHTRERPEDPSKPRRSGRKTLQIAAGAVAVLAIAAVSARLWIWHPPVRFPATTSCVTFLPLENPTGDEVLEAWRTSFPYLISMDFVQSRVIGSWNQGDLFVALDDMKLWGAPKFSSEEIVRIGQRLGCGHIATGSLRKFDGGIVLELAMRNPQTAEITHTFRGTCRGEEGIFDMTDALSREIKLALSIPRRLVSHDIDEKIGDITTRSPEAFHFYCQADRLAWQGKSLDSSQLFQKAVEADPQFAEAYYGLFRACRGTLAPDEIIRYGAKAVEFSDRLNVWARYQVRGDFYQSFQRDYDKAIAAYQGLLAIMHDDLAEYSLAQIYQDLEEYEKAIPLLEKARYRVKDNEYIIRLMAECRAAYGLVDEAIKLLDEHQAGNSKVSEKFLRIRANFAAIQGRFDEALAFLDQLHSLYPNSPRFVRTSKIPVYIAMDDLESAGRELKAIAGQEDKKESAQAEVVLGGVELTKGRIGFARERARSAVAAAIEAGDPKTERMARLSSAYLAYLVGDRAEALREVEIACPNEAEAKIADLRALHLRALIALGLGRTEEFELRLEGIRQLVERERYPKLMRTYFHLLGLKELRADNADKAIDYFWKALKLLPSPIGKSNADTDSGRYYFSLAEAYLKAGAYARAADMYERVPNFWEQRALSGDIYARSFYERARARELISRQEGLTEAQRKDEEAKAVEGYRKFLALWQAADPVFKPLVEDARERFAALSQGLGVDRTPSASNNLD